jgi:hypothetical protein
MASEQDKLEKKSYIITNVTFQSTILCSVVDQSEVNTSLEEPATIKRTLAFGEDLDFEFLVLL